MGAVGMKHRKSPAFMFWILLFSACAVIPKAAEWVEVQKSGESIVLESAQGNPVGIRVANIGTKDLSDIKILRQGQRDFTTIEVMLDQITKGKTTDKDKVLSLFDFIIQNRIQYKQPPPDESEPHDPV